MASLPRGFETLDLRERERGAGGERERCLFVLNLDVSQEKEVLCSLSASITKDY